MLNIIQFCSEYSVALAAVSVAGVLSLHFFTKVKTTKEKREQEPSKQVNICIGEYEYDITHFKHPGGNVIFFMTQGQDATNAFEEFHYRSKKARRILDFLPKEKIVNDDTHSDRPATKVFPLELSIKISLETSQESSTQKPSREPSPEPSPESSLKPSLEPSPEPSLKSSPEPSPKKNSPEPSLKPSSEPSPEPSLKPSQEPSKGGGQGGTSFPLFRKSLEERGFFKPSYSHIAYRVVELCGIYSAAMYMIPINIYVSVLLFGFFGGKCGWLQHEGGHNSLTGIIAIDKGIQNVCIGFGLFTDGNMWNHMHNRHHATPQKIGHDMDLDTAPLVAFHKDVIIGGNWLVQWWLRFQMVTFLPITSGMLVMFFWVLYLHPRKIIRDKNISQACIVAVGHTSRILSFMILGNMDVYHALLCHVGSLWVSGVFLFGHFSLSHTFTPIVKEDENPDWVRYAIEHTVDIEPDNPIVCWVMGYLNCQVIHHLFPSMPQFRGPEVSRELMTYCKKWGIEYRIVSYGEAWRLMASNLYEVGNH